MKRTVEETLEEMGSIALENLTNPIHRELVKDTLINARQCEALVEDLPEELAALEAAYDEELEASLIEDKIQRLTAEIVEGAEERSFAQTALKSAIRGVMGLADPEKVDGATLLFGLMHKYDLHVGQKPCRANNQEAVNSSQEQPQAPPLELARKRKKRTA